MLDTATRENESERANDFPCQHCSKLPMLEWAEMDINHGRANVEVAMGLYCINANQKAHRFCKPILPALCDPVCSLLVVGMFCPKHVFCYP